MNDRQSATLLIVIGLVILIVGPLSLLDSKKDDPVIELPGTLIEATISSTRGFAQSMTFTIDESYGKRRRLKTSDSFDVGKLTQIKERANEFKGQLVLFTVYEAGDDLLALRTMDGREVLSRRFTSNATLTNEIGMVVGGVSLLAFSYFLSVSKGPKKNG
jgi:hypothetical protein